MGTLLPDKIYQQLRRKMLAGELHPGARLDYRKISTEMGVSPTPVREAMGKLASEGLVDLIPRAGAIVRELGRDEAAQLYGVREAIETFAVGRAAETISAPTLQRLHTVLDRMRELIHRASTGGNRVMNGTTLPEYLEADLAFHMTIIDAAGNPRLSKLAADNHIHARVFGMERAGHNLEWIKEADQAHRHILQALEKRSADSAVTHTTRHIRRSLELTLAHLDQSAPKSW